MIQEPNSDCMVSDLPSVPSSLPAVTPDTIDFELIGLPRPGRAKRVATVVGLALIVAAGGGFGAMRMLAEADRPYDDFDAFATHLGARTISVPADITLPTSEGDDSVVYAERPFDIPPSPVSIETLSDLFRNAPSPPEPKDAWLSTVIYISRTQLRVDQAGLTIPIPTDAAQSGFEARFKGHGRTDVYIVPLGQSLLWVHDTWTQIAKASGKDPNDWGVTFVADRDTPASILKEVIFTAGQAGIQHLRLSFSKGRQLTGVMEPPPRR